MHKKLVLHLGSNCGDRMNHLKLALGELEKGLGTAPIVSSYFETAAWGKEDQENFINVAALYELPEKQDVFDVLRLIIFIETRMKRKRFEKWGPRIIDIDILYWGSDLIKNKLLEIPHPLLHKRRFVLEPLLEIAPDFVHPVLQKNTIQLYSELEDPLDVWKLENPLN